MPVQPRIADPAEVSAALASPAFTMPPVPGGPAVGIRWLRGSVARFSDGADHERRRRLVTGSLTAVASAELRERAAARTRAVLDGRPLRLVASEVTVDVLVAALAMPPVRAADVAVVATAYQPGSGAEAPADEAVVRLVDAFGGTPDDATAAGIGLLVQACAATAGLVDNAARAMARAAGDRPVDAIVAETLLRDPPVRTTRRLAAATGTVVEIDLAASGLPFGSGPHRCPGREHATAIATGILAAVRHRRARDQVSSPRPAGHA